MQAFHLIKSINSILNEDKFATYTMKQIYDELGRDDFVTYIKKLLTKIINKTEILKDAELDTRIGTLHMYFIFSKDMPS
jgi:hypothetical protein